MLRTLSFVLPVLLPSWRFFQSIEASPRVEWASVDNDNAPTRWQEFRPHPQHISLLQMFWFLFWNPTRNADLFIVSCAERIRAAPNEHSINVIRDAIQSDIQEGLIFPSTDEIQFRLVFVHREDKQLVRETVYVSDSFPALGE